MTAAQDDALNVADKRWGYKFGCNGLMRTAEVCQHLSISRWTVDRLAEDGRIRKGKDANCNRVVFCRRSIDAYVASLEV